MAYKQGLHYHCSVLVSRSYDTCGDCLYHYMNVIFMFAVSQSFVIFVQVILKVYVIIKYISFPDEFRIVLTCWSNGRFFCDQCTLFANFF